MKIFIFLMLFVPALVFGQAKFLEPVTASQMDLIVDEVKLLSGKAYVVESIDTTKTKRGIIFNLKYDERNIAVVFSLLEHGGNVDFEQAPKQQWYFTKIVGPYLDLFPYWKSKFQPDADDQVISYDGHGKMILLADDKRRRATFKKGPGAWVIEVFHR
jgi:hypothetical protein